MKCNIRKCSRPRRSNKGDAPAHGCYRFILPATFEKPRRRMEGTVSPCDDDSASQSPEGTAVPLAPQPVRRF